MAAARPAAAMASASGAIPAALALTVQEGEVCSPERRPRRLAAPPPRATPPAAHLLSCPSLLSSAAAPLAPAHPHPTSCQHCGHALPPCPPQQRSATPAAMRLSATPLPSICTPLPPSPQLASTHHPPTSPPPTPPHPQARARDGAARGAERRRALPQPPHHRRHRAKVSHCAQVQSAARRGPLRQLPGQPRQPRVHPPPQYLLTTYKLQTKTKSSTHTHTQETYIKHDLLDVDPNQPGVLAELRSGKFVVPVSPG